MNKRQRDKLNMYELVRDFLKSSVEITSKWITFAPLFDIFVAIIKEIYDVSEEQETSTIGDTVEKNKFRGKVEYKFVDCSFKCMAYASEMEDDSFLEKVIITETEPEKYADNELIRRGENLVKLATPKLELLKPYLLVQDDLTDLTKLIDHYKDKFIKPRDESTDTKLETAKLDAIYKKADNHLLKMDRVLGAGIKSDPDFYTAYMTKRGINKTGVHKRALEIWVLDKGTGQPIGKAKVKIKKVDGPQLKKYTHSVGEKGGTYYNSLESGEYEFEVSLFGYETFKGKFFINAGIMTKIEVKLLKLATGI